MNDRPTALSVTPTGYADWLADLKSRIHTAQQRATLAVNRELVLLYWQIGRDILTRQADQGWGAKVIERLAHDLRDTFPEIKGFSARNLKYMRYFAEHCPAGSIGQQPAAQLPWFHMVCLASPTALSDTLTEFWLDGEFVQASLAQLLWSSTTSPRLGPMSRLPNGLLDNFKLFETQLSKLQSDSLCYRSPDTLIGSDP